MRAKTSLKQKKLTVRGQMINQSSIPATQSGFTIIESLMAIIVVTILMVALAPVLVLATAARVQARRVELATQAAKSYIDGVNAETILPPNQIVVLNENSSGNFSAQRANLANVAAPALSDFSANCSAATYCSQNATANTGGVSSLYCVDIDGNGCNSSSPVDLIVQGFRSVPSAAATNPQSGYLLGVRVYRASAFISNGGALVTQTQRGGRQSIFVGTLGDAKAPLIEITTEMSSNATKYTDYCNRFGGCQ